jgi:hypothetical protein
LVLVLTALLLAESVPVLDEPVGVEGATDTEVTIDGLAEAEVVEFEAVDALAPLAELPPPPTGGGTTLDWSTRVPIPQGILSPVPG